MNETTTNKIQLADLSDAEAPAFLRDVGAFNDWKGLRDSLVEIYELEDAVIRLQADHSKNGSEDCYGRMEVEVISSESVLLAMFVGFQTKLSIHLVRSENDVLGGRMWRANVDFKGMLLCAKGIFERAVRDRAVDLMSKRGDSQVVSFFLDEKGKVEIASSNARSFCSRFANGEALPEGYLPRMFWVYYELMRNRLSERPEGRAVESSLVYCYNLNTCILTCLLQGMGRSGSLLSVSIDE